MKRDHPTAIGRKRDRNQNADSKGECRHTRSPFGPMDVDIEGIVRGQDLVYEDGATCWQDGHILGNGDLGAIAYAPHWLEWTVNKVDVMDARNAPIAKRLTYREVVAEAERRQTRHTHFLSEIERPDPAYRGPRQPQLKSCGQVKIRTLANEYVWAAPPPYTCRQVLSLWEATDHMALSLGGGGPFEKVKEFHPRVESFVSRRRNVMAIRMSRVQGPLWGKRIELVRPPDADYPAPEFGRSKDGATVWLHQRGPDGSSYAMALAVQVTGGVFEYHDPLLKEDRRDPAGLVGVEHRGDRIWITVKGDVDVFVSAASSRETKDPLRRAKGLVATALAEGYEAVANEHRAWWSAFWRRSFIQIENDAMREQLWYLGLYQMASSLGRAPVPGLNGLWYGFTDSAVQKVFHADYTLDINVQSASMPAWMVNHPELGQPFLDTFLKALPVVQALTRKRFELPGAGYFPLEMCLDSAAVPEPFFTPAYRMSLTGGPYCGLLYAWAYRYTQDNVLLRKKVYPFLREVVRFWAAFLKQGSDGRYVIPWLVPCEVLTLSRNAMDIVSLLKPCLETAVEASRILNLDGEERAKWEDILRHYPEYPRAKGRFIHGQDIDPERESYHMSQLWPLVLAHDSSPEVRALSKTTLEYWREYFSARSPERRHCPSSWPGFLEILGWLHIGDRRGADAALDDYIRNMLKPNGLTPHMPLSVKHAGPRHRELAAATPECLTDMVMILTEQVLQSHNQLIRVFPGVVGKRSVRFGNLRAEGAFLVSAEMVRGKVTFVGITAEKSGLARIANPWHHGPVHVAGKTAVAPVRGRLIAIEMTAGETIVLSPEPMRTRRITPCHEASVKVRRLENGTTLLLGKPKQAR